MNDESEAMVRRALKDEAEGYRPGDWTGAAAGIHERGLRRRRTIRGAAAVALAVTATAGTAVGVALASSSHGTAAHQAQAAGQPSAQASKQPSPGVHSSSVADPAPWPAVRVVPLGKHLLLDGGIWMTLTQKERCVGQGSGVGAGSSCKSITDGNQPQNTVGLQSGGDKTGMYFSPLYIGSGVAARMTVDVEGTTYRVNIVTLAGHPGYATGYVWVPESALPKGNTNSPFFPHTSVTVYDAQGRVLAGFDPPKH